MLSSITLASVQAARDKGRIAAGLKFASYNYHAIGVDTIAYWNFDGSTSCNNVITSILCVADGLGGKMVLKTYSNYNETNPTSSNFDAYLSSNTPTGKGKSGILDTNHYFANTVNLGFSADRQISKANLQPKDFTVSVWVYFTSANPNGAIVHASKWFDESGGEWSSGALETVFGLDTDGSQYICYSDAFNNASVSFGPILKDTWQNITCSFNSTTGVITGFLDGKKISSVNATFNQNFYSSGLPINSISVGTDDGSQPSPPYPPSYTGRIDDVIIYGSSLVESDVRSLYARAAPGIVISKK